MNYKKMNSTIRNKLIVASFITLVFFGFLATSLWYYWLVDLFLITIAVVLLERFDRKNVLLVLSPILTYPVLYVYVALLAKMIFSQYQVSTILFLGFPIVFGILYAYFFRNMFVSLIGKRLRWIGFGLMCLVWVASFLSSSVVDQCYDISRAEKGITSEEVNYCRFFSLYHPTSSNKFSGMSQYLRQYTLIPPMIILIGMFTYSIIQRRKQTL